MWNRLSSWVFLLSQVQYWEDARWLWSSSILTCPAKPSMPGLWARIRVLLILTLLFSSLVGTLLIGLWITPNWLLNLVFLRKNLFWRVWLYSSILFIHSSALVQFPTTERSIWETEDSRNKNVPSSASGPLEKVISAFWIKYWWCNSGWEWNHKRF